MCLLYYEKYRWMVGWIEKKSINGWKDKKNRLIVGWMEGYTIIYIYIYIQIDGWQVGRKKIRKKQMDGQMDRRKKLYEKNDGMLDGQKNI